MRNLIFALSALIIFNSCNKDPIQYSFEGKITESVGGSNLAGVTITIYQIPFNSSVTSNNFELAASTITDSEGNYAMSFEREKVTEFKINLMKEGYYKRDINISSGDISSENTNILNYEMEPESWISFKIKNLFPADASDNLNLLLLNYREGCEQCATGDYYSFEGITDTTVVFSSTAGQYFNFTYIEVGASSASDSLFMTPYDTVNYEINY